MPTHAIALYIHFPWCIKKCPYCDFNSYGKKGNLPEKEYCQALLYDLEQELKVFAEPPTLISIYFGGGTPSLFAAKNIALLLQAIRKKVALQKNCEITLEANPGTVDEKKLHAFRKAGINRISIGVQSFNDGALKTLGRIHDAKTALTAIELAKKSGFTNINLDLMYALPNQTVVEALADLKQAIALQPQHISWYQLTIEPNTPFGKMKLVASSSTDNPRVVPTNHGKTLTLPDESTMEAIEQQGKKLLAQAGFKQYEVSAFAQKEWQAKHNLNYWRFGDYIGIGAGAHGKITLQNQNGALTIYRRSKKILPQEYLATAANRHPEKLIAAEQQLAEKNLPLEFMLNALRLKNGFSKKLFTERTNLPITKITTILEQAEKQHLLSYKKNKIKTTALGWRYLHNLLELFVVS